MKNCEIFDNPVTSMKEEGNAAATFSCPACCVMGDTCEQCSKHGSDDWCYQFGGYTDPDKWACSWYYSH